MDSEKLICKSDELEDSSSGFRFNITYKDEVLPAFVVRFNGEVRGYINRCGHISLELDFIPGRFFDRSREYLMCSTHGALYNPETGRCIGGPCQGKGLQPIAVVEKNQGIYWSSADGYIT